MHVEPLVRLSQDPGVYAGLHNALSRVRTNTLQCKSSPLNVVQSKLAQRPTTPPVDPLEDLVGEEAEEVRCGDEVRGCRTRQRRKT